MYTVTQNIAESLVGLPALDQAAYAYMRALAHNPEQPGCFWISHVALAKKLNVSRATAERITQRLRKKRWDLIALKRRGAGKYHTANFYTILPLTQARLDALKKALANPSSVRAPSPSPVRDHRLSSKARKSERALKSARSQEMEKSGRPPLRLVSGGVR